MEAFPLDLTSGSPTEKSCMRLLPVSIRRNGFLPECRCIVVDRCAFSLRFRSAVRNMLSLEDLSLFISKAS